MNINNPNNRQITELRELWCEAFGDTDEFLDGFFNTAYSADRSLCAMDNGRVTAALYWFSCEYHNRRAAYIYAVATFKEYRGQGICKRLMAAAHERLKAQGYSCSVLVPGEKSLFDFYSGLGYSLCGTVNTFSCTAKDKNISVTELDKTEYAQLRRLYLPSGGVIQEGENLDFLTLGMKLYKGTDFVMAASAADGVLYCAELLGNTDNADGITYALSCCEGRFRTAGGNTPFAMWFPLDEGISPPKYFGLAFD